MKIKIELNEELLNKVAEITMTRYDDDDIESMIEDLVCYYHNLEEEFEDYKQNVQDNYKQIKYEDMI